MRLFSALPYALLGLLVVALASCSGVVAEPPAAPADFTLNGTVDRWAWGDATVAATFSKGSGATVATGTLAAGGELWITLSGTVSQADLQPLATCPDLIVSTPGVRMNSFSELEVEFGGLRGGVVARASSREVLTTGLHRKGDFLRQYTYVDSNATLYGACLFAAVGVTMRYDLDLNAGWNEVVFSLERVGPAGKLLLSVTSAPPPSAGAWHFEALPSP